MLDISSGLTIQQFLVRATIDTVHLGLYDNTFSWVQTKLINWIHITLLAVTVCHYLMTLCMNLYFKIRYMYMYDIKQAILSK